MAQPALLDSMVAIPGNSTNPGLIHPLATDLFNTLPIAVYICDRDGYITSYNQVAVKLWGREPEIGKDLWCGSWKIFHPDGSPMNLDTCPMARTLKNGKPVEGEEIIVQRPDGTKRNVLPYPVPIFDTKGELTGATNTLLDITDQKTGEVKQARLAAIIESSDDAIISKTLDGIITSWNKAAEKLFGYTEQEVIGSHISILIPKPRLEEERLIIERVRNNKNIDHFETIRVTKSGQEIPISLTVSPIRDNKGLIIGASKIARDISRQRFAESEIKRYAENLELLNYVGKTVSEDLDIESILQKVTDVTTQLSGAAFGAFSTIKLMKRASRTYYITYRALQKKLLKNLDYHATQPYSIQPLEVKG